MKINIINYGKDLDYALSYGGLFNELQGKSILVTGANGLIASCLIDVLMYLNLKRSYNIDIYALCRNIDKAKIRFEEYKNYNKFHILNQDVCEPINLDIKINYIIHAASNAHPLAYSKYPVETMKTNFLGTMNLLNYSKDYKIERLLYVSTSEVYGENLNISNGFDEECWGKINILNPRSCYSESKRAAETLCVSYMKEYQTDVVIARPGYIYGPMITEENSRADAQFLRNALGGNDIVMKSKGEQVRSYCYVMDTATALLTILLKGRNGEAYNIANRNSEVSISEFAKAIAEYANVGLKFEIPDSVETQGYSVISKSVLNSQKLEGLGWRPVYSLNQGIKHMINDLSV